MKKICIRCGHSLKFSGSSWINRGRVVLFDDETEWVRCLVCGFGVTVWKNGRMETNQWVGWTADGRNIWRSKWQTIPDGCLLIAGEQNV